MHSKPLCRTLLAATLVAMVPVSAAIADAHEASDDDATDDGGFGGWSGSASVGATSATGASESSSVNATIRLNKAYERWEHLLTGSVFKGRSTTVVTEEDETGQPVRRVVEGDNADRVAVGYQPKYFFTDRTYGFGLFDYESDPPANIDSAFRQVVGVGHRFYENDSGYLSAEVGVGNKNTDQVSGDDLDGAIGYVGVNYLERFTDTLSFNADFRSDFGGDNTFVEIGLGLTVELNDRLSARLSHFTRGNDGLDAGDSPLDTDRSSLTTLNLVFDI